MRISLKSLTVVEFKMYYQITELEKYGAEAKNLKHRGATITLKNGPTRYDYSHIQQINELKERIKSLESRHKQAAKTDATMLDDNGEMIEPAIIKQGKQVINIKFD